MMGLQESATTGVLRMRCGRFRCGSPTLVCRRCFSLASSCRLPYRAREWASFAVISLRATFYLLDDLALPDDALQLFHDERADPH